MTSVSIVGLGEADSSSATLAAGPTEGIRHLTILLGAELRR
jgi:hypothetical protein